MLSLPWREGIVAARAAVGAEGLHGPLLDLLQGEVGLVQLLQQAQIHERLWFRRRPLQLFEHHLGFFQRRKGLGLNEAQCDLLFLAPVSERLAG